MFSTLALGDFLRRHIQAHLNTTATNISFSSEVAGKPYDKNDDEKKQNKNKNKQKQSKFTAPLNVHADLSLIAHMAIFSFFRFEQFSYLAYPLFQIGNVT